MAKNATFQEKYLVRSYKRSPVIPKHLERIFLLFRLGGFMYFLKGPEVLDINANRKKQCQILEKIVFI